MTLQELIDELTKIRDRDPCVGRSSPVIVEGWNEDGDLVQGSIESVSTEARCEDDDEFQAVYINLSDDTERDPVNGQAVKVAPSGGNDT